MYIYIYILYNIYSITYTVIQASLVFQMVKNPPAMRRPGFDPVLGISPGGGHGNPLQYSCLEKPHGQRSLVTVHGVTTSLT